MRAPLAGCLIFCALAAVQALFLILSARGYLAASPEVRQPHLTELELAQCFRLFPGLTPRSSEEASDIETSSPLALSNQTQQPLEAIGQAVVLEDSGYSAVQDNRNSSEKQLPNALVFPLILLPRNVTEDTAQWDWRGTREGDLKGDDYAELLRWCLKSLLASGPIDYELLFIVNQHGREMIMAMEEARPFTLRFHVFGESFTQSTDAFLPKLRVIDALEVLDADMIRYDRILVLDVDIMALGPISELLQRIERRDIVYVKPEQTYCEKQLACFDEDLFSLKRYSRVELFCLSLTGHVPMNGGIYGFRDGRVLRNVLRSLREGTLLMKHSPYMDQPIFNHILSTTHMRRPGGLIDYELFQRCVVMSGEEANSKDVILVHYNFDSQNSKLYRMKEAYKDAFGA